VPELINYEYHLQAIEMSVVSPPCVLDFGKTRLDQPADYSPEVRADAEAMERELFEPDQWKQVGRIRVALRMLGVYYYDARPSNIIFANT
jgi:hypothetical protein